METSKRGAMRVKFLHRYDIDMTKCIYCGFCQVALQFILAAIYWLSLQHWGYIILPLVSDQADVLVIRVYGKYALTKRAHLIHEAAIYTSANQSLSELND